jgi:alpha-tubulin suppressor-like RCC1 family protein
MERSIELNRAQVIRTVALLLLVVNACSDSGGPDVVDPEPTRRLIAGERVACALTAAGLVSCWGQNTDFWDYAVSPATHAGSGVPNPADVPVLASLARGVGTHYCGIASSQNAVCWARGGVGQLGGGVFGNIGNPSNIVTGGIKWADIAVGRLTTCGVSDTGIGYCWGFNQQGEAGSASIALGGATFAPHPVDGGHTFKTIATGWLHTCGITIAGAAYCWGSNSHGQLGIGTADTIRYRTPMPVSGGLTFSRITLGSRYTCGLTTDGAAYCWGTNGTGQLGVGTLLQRTTPSAVHGDRKFWQIVASSGFADGAFETPPIPLQGGVGHTCALTRDGKPYCWGWNGNGELGDGTNFDRLTPTAVAGELTLNTIAVGGAYTCGMQDNKVWCWGSNRFGQLGSEDPSPALAPRVVMAPFNTR